MRAFRVLVLAASMLCVWSGTHAGALIQPKEAPEWQVSEWLNGDPGPLNTHQGRVVVINFFQLWCPGSNSFSIPLMQRWDQKYGDRDDIMFVSIHSVFEGHDIQTPEQLRRFVREKGIMHPVGVDAYEGDDPVPVTMRRYAAQGTPQIVIINKEGQQVFSHFGSFDPAPVEYFIDRLLKEETTYRPRPKPTSDVNHALSGSYRLILQQTANTCGPLRPPSHSPVVLEVHADNIVVLFSEQYLGHSRITLEYDNRTGSIDSKLDARDTYAGEPYVAELQIHGGFVPGTSPAELDYEFALMKRGSRPGDSCEIEARGRVIRTQF